MPRRHRPRRRRRQCRRCPAGARQSDAHKIMGTAARTRRRWRRRGRFGPFSPRFRDGVPRRDRIIARALWRPRVHLQSATRPTGRCRRHTRARVLPCRSGTHSEGGPARFVVTRTLPHDALRMRLPAHSAGPHAWRCRPNLSWRRRRRCVPSPCASGRAVAPASAHGSTNCERTTRRAGAFLGSFCVRIRF